MIPASQHPVPGSLGTGAARLSPAGASSDPVEGLPPGASPTAQQVEQVLRRVRPDPATASTLERAVDLSKGLGTVLAYGLAVTVAISLLPESLLLALLLSLKSPAKGQAADPQGEPADTASGTDTETNSDMETDPEGLDSRGTEGEPDSRVAGWTLPHVQEGALPGLEVSDYALTGEEGVSLPVSTLAELPPEHTLDQEAAPPSAPEGESTRERRLKEDEINARRHADPASAGGHPAPDPDPDAVAV